MLLLILFLQVTGTEISTCTEISNLSAMYVQLPGNGTSWYHQNFKKIKLQKLGGRERKYSLSVSGVSTSAFRLEVMFNE